MKVAAATAKDARFIQTLLLVSIFRMAMHGERSMFRETPSVSRGAAATRATQKRKSITAIWTRVIHSAANPSDRKKRDPSWYGTEDPGRVVSRFPTFSS